jgi:hypothetical protein
MGSFASSQAGPALKVAGTLRVPSACEHRKHNCFRWLRHRPCACYFSMVQFFTTSARPLRPQRQPAFVVGAKPTASPIVVAGCLVAKKVSQRNPNLRASGSHARSLSVASMGRSA